MIGIRGIGRKRWRALTRTILFAGLTLSGTTCNRDRLETTEAPFDAGIASAVQGVLEESRHPWLVRDVPGWTRERIESAMRAERPTQVNLREPLRVVIFYDTVHVNSENIVHFVGDIYGHDRILDEALERGYPYPEAD